MLEEFISSRGLEQVALVGTAGCAISLAFTERHPDRVKALVLCNPLTEATFLGGWLGPLLWLRERMPESIGRCTGAWAPEITNGIGSAASLFQLGPRGRPSKSIAAPKSSRALRGHRPKLESLLGVLDDLENYAVVDNLAAAGSPICTIWGLKNKIVSPRRDVA